jgi:uncharacterized membrane protein YhhN
VLIVSWFAVFIVLLLSDTVKCRQPLFVAVAHIESKILMLSLEGTERHQRRYRRVYLVGGFLLLGLMLALASDSITTLPIAQARTGSPRWRTTCG